MKLMLDPDDFEGKLSSIDKEDGGLIYFYYLRLVDFFLNSSIIPLPSWVWICSTVLIDSTVVTLLIGGLFFPLFLFAPYGSLGS